MSSAPVEHLRIVEAMLFAASEPLDEDTLSRRLPDGIDISALMRKLQEQYSGRGVELTRVNDKWFLRTARDLAHLMEDIQVTPRKLSRAATETLAIVAYHQPVTRAEIEDIRGVSVSKGTIDVLMKADWVKIRGRRQTPGRPVTYGTTDAFLVHFDLETIKDLPGLAELRATGLLAEQPEPLDLFSQDEDGDLPEDGLDQADRERSDDNDAVF